MIKFFYGNSSHSDAEYVLENVNKYVRLRDNEGYVNYSDEDMYILLNDLDEYIVRVNGGYAVNPTLSVDSTSSIKHLIKRLFRKALQWAFNDIVARQNEYNAVLVQYINSESFLLRILCDECISLQEENVDLKIKLKEIENMGDRDEN